MVNTAKARAHLPTFFRHHQSRLGRFGDDAGNLMRHVVLPSCMCCPGRAMHRKARRVSAVDPAVGDKKAAEKEECPDREGSRIDAGKHVVRTETDDVVRVIPYDKQRTKQAQGVHRGEAVFSGETHHPRRLRAR